MAPGRARQQRPHIRAPEQPNLRTQARRTRNVRTFTVRTPLDGSLTTSLSAPAGAHFRVAIGSKAVSSSIVCGQRTTQLTVTRVRGYGAFTLHVTLP